MSANEFSKYRCSFFEILLYLGVSYLLIKLVRDFQKVFVIFLVNDLAIVTLCHFMRALILVVARPIDFDN